MRSRLARHKILASLLSLSFILPISFAAFKSINYFHAEEIPANGSELELDDFEWLWEYNNTIYDLSPEALLGDRNEFETWKNSTEPNILSFFDKVQIPKPNFQSITNETWEDRGFDLKSINFTFPDGVFNVEKDIKTLVALPLMLNALSCKPIIIAISGHEISPWGEAPLAIFEPGGWGYKFAKAGYIVYAPPNIFYDDLTDLWLEHDYYVVWTEIQRQLFGAVSEHLPSNCRYAVAGLSSGASVSAFLMARIDTIELGVLSEILFPLDYLRENYRIKDHPNSFDVSFLYSYLPLYALIAPRPLQFQMGRKDDLFPNSQPVSPKQGFFPGTPRGVSSDEMVGEYLLMNQIWEKYGKSIDLVIHNGGHEFDFSSAEKFFYDHFCN